LAHSDASGRTPVDLLLKNQPYACTTLNPEVRYPSWCW